MIAELFAAVGREVTVQEPVLTWNLFWTTILVPVCTAVSSAVIIGYINRKHKEREARYTEAAELRKEIEELKEKATKEWRENHTNIMCLVKTRLDGVVNGLDKKVDKEDCDRLMAR